MVTFTINIPPMLAYIPYMDPMHTWILWDTNIPIDYIMGIGLYVQYTQLEVFVVALKPASFTFIKLITTLHH